jgi:hypothetical protein
MTNWKDKLPFLDAAEPVSKSIQGEPVNFYPISAGKIFKLKGLAKPIGKILASIGGGKDDTIGSETTRFAGTDNDPAGETIKIQAINPVLEQQRADRKQKAVSELIDALTDDSNIGIVGEILIDSMRDVFPRGDKDNPPGRQFIVSLDLPILAEMVAGVLAANKEIFGPLGGTVESLVQSKMNEVLADNGSGPASVAGTISPRQDEETRGSTSPTPSSGSQPEDTASSG